MKVAIHITHTEADDLSGVQAAAAELGLAFTVRGDFMGRHHTEVSGEISSGELEAMLASVGAGTSLAA